MSMGLDDLRTDLAAMLGCVADKFTDPAGLNLLLTTAAADLSRRKPTVISADLTVSAEVSDYACPPDLLRVMGSDWGVDERAEFSPWESSYPQRLPNLRLATVDGTEKLQIVPTPTAAQVNALGSTLPYRYVLAYSLSETASETTVPARLRDLLLLRAVAEAMQTLAAQGVTTPITLGPGGDNRAKNGTPAALADSFMNSFLSQAAA